VLQRAKEGDRKAFEQIYQMYHRRIYNAVYGMLSDADDAQDVTQDVFIRLHDALPTLRADEAFSTYLYRIALNLCRDRARRKKRVRFQSMDTPRTDSEGEVEPMEFPDLGKLPEETIAGEELQKRVRQAVQNLSEDHKAVIVMHHFQGHGSQRHRAHTRCSHRHRQEPPCPWSRPTPSQTARLPQRLNGGLPLLDADSLFDPKVCSLTAA
jgi:RNA polymerase sigma-70 factor (ECF subfamily)